MATFRELLSRILTFLNRRRLDRDTEAEMRFHLDMEEAAAIRQGLPLQEARRQAALRSGSIAAAMEQVRDQRGLGPFDGTLADLKQAAVGLIRRPGYLLVAGGVLAASVSVNTLIFSIVNGVFLKPLPYRAPERLVNIYESTPRNPKFPVSIYNYLEDKRSSTTLDGIALFTGDDLHWTHERDAERLRAVAITDDFFPTLGVSPALGRNFTLDEMQGAKVVILSDRFWRSRFGADPHIVGRTIRLNREAWSIVGVMPASFQHVGGSYRSPLQGDTVAVWHPLSLKLSDVGLRAFHFTNAIARLKPGVTIQAATEDLNRIMDDLKRRYPDNYGTARARVEPLASEVLGRSTSTLAIIAAGGALVLLVACVNIAGLSVARMLARRREIAVRQALGGSRWRLVRAVLSENVILGAAAGTFGLALAAALMPVLRITLPVDFPRLHEIGLTWTVALFALFSAMATSLVASMVPALRQTAANPAGSLSEGGRAASANLRATSLRGGLVAAEIALSCVLCFVAVLLVRSSLLLEARQHGFDSTGVLTYELTLPRAGYTKPEQRVAFFEELIRRTNELPGVTAAGLTSTIPWTGYDENTSFDIPGRVRRDGESIQARFQAADPGVARALKLPLLAGRWIEDSDHAKAPRVIVVNQAFARRYFADTQAVGQQVKIWDDLHTIVGVVADVHDRPADATAEPAFWWPLARQPFNSVRAVVRTAGDPLALAPAVREVVRSLDGELPVAELRTMDDIATQALAERRFALWISEAFAILAMLLAAIGVYGVLAYLVEQRHREIGIRMAIGATRMDVVRLIASACFALAGAGVVAGLVMAPAAGWAASALLYGVTPTDALALAIAPALILLVTLAGSLLPSWSAARTEPVSVLREQ